MSLKKSERKCLYFQGHRKVFEIHSKKIYDEETLARIVIYFCIIHQHLNRKYDAKAYENKLIILKFSFISLYITIFSYIFFTSLVRISSVKFFFRLFLVKRFSGAIRKILLRYIRYNLYSIFSRLSIPYSKHIIIAMSNVIKGSQFRVRFIVLYD